MLKKLRVKFVAIIMSMVALVLVGVFSVICVINYQQSTQTVYDSMNAATNRAAQHNSPFPQEGFAPVPFDDGESDLSAEGAPPAGDASDLTDGKLGRDGRGEAQGSGGAGNGGMQPFEIGGAEKDKEMIPVAVYTVGADGALTSVTNTATAIIADDLLEEAAAKALAASDERGLLDSIGLYFLKHDIEGTTYLAFADQESGAGWQALALNLTLVGIAALVVFFAASLVFSQWALKPVRESWMQQQRFIADASHDLKTPLTVMLASTSILLGHPEKTVASQRQWVESIESEAMTMHNLVTDLLFLAESSEPEALGNKAAVDLSTVVERNLLQFEPLAFEKSIGVSSDIIREAKVIGNEAHLDRLVGVLLDNAFKYAGDEGTVAVVLRLDGTQAVALSVSNTGTSIPEEDLPHVFDRFYRVDKVRERSVEGYGLGLSIAQEIVDEHRGTIKVASTQAEGTSFTVSLPLG